MLIYDIEIIKAIPSNREPLQEGIQYCKGWGDYENMGVSVIGAYDYEKDRYRVFCEDNRSEFFEAANVTDLLIGFNNINFDNEVLKHYGSLPVEDDRYYDLLREVWAAAGLGPTFEYPSHAGYGLDACCETNGLGRKTGHGAVAPVQWQQRKVGAVIDYCLQDVALTKKLFDKVLSGEEIQSPTTGEMLTLRAPRQ